METLMSEIPAYMIANLVVRDTDEYRKYEKGFFPILKRFGGEFFTYDDSHEILEGNRCRRPPCPSGLLRWGFSHWALGEFIFEWL